MNKESNRLKRTIRALEKDIVRLNAENFQLKNIIEHLPGDIYWKNKEGTWLGVNSTGSTTLKKMSFIVEKSEVIGKTDFQLFNKETAEQFRKHDLEVMERQIEITNEETNILPSGERLIQLSTKRPLYNEKGEAVGIVGNTVDITYLKRIESDLKEAKEKAEAASRAKSEFIANISHDLRTPLTGVVTMSDDLKDKLKGLEGAQEAVWLHESGEQLLEFCNSILDSVSADNYTERDLKEECFDLRQLIQAAGNLEMPMIKSKGLNFIVNIDTNIPSYLIKDKAKLYRILLNLLGNAIKFTDNGHVGIDINLIDQDNNHVTLKFCVDDTGIGIKPELQAQIFDRFFRINPSYKGIYKGNGLGLFIAQKYVRLLGADRIYVESEEGKGSRFIFTLSFKPGNQKDAVQIVTEQEHQFQQISHSSSSAISKNAQPIEDNAPFLLLIEDNKPALHGLEAMIKKTGCRFKSAENGESGVELATTHDFDLIISDIGLPVISGIEVTKAIRAWEKENHKKRVPIVAVTGHAALLAEPECLQAGMDKVLTKPASLDNIKNIIRQFIPKNEDFD